MDEIIQNITTGYKPRAWQDNLHKKMKRFNVIVTHRRAGKSIFATNHIIDHALRNKNSLPQYAYIAPTFAQAKRIIWSPLKKFTEKLPGVQYNEQDLRVDLVTNKARIMLLSAENYESLKGIYLDGVVLDEHAMMNPSVWNEGIRPTLVDRKGWAIFCSTPKGQNQFYDLYQHARNPDNSAEWFQAVFRASETGIIDEDELKSLRSNMTEEEYLQEFECDFNAGLSHAYFAKDIKRAENENRIVDLPYDPMIPVDTYWDLGVSDSTAVIFVQSTKFDHRIIDFYEVNGDGLNRVIPEVVKRPYNIRNFVLPHDVKVRDLSTGKSRLQVFYSMGAKNCRVVPRVGDKMESINAARMIFGKCYFDRTRCEPLLKRLMNYQKKWDDKAGVYLKTPLHNFASHASDAFQTFAMGTEQAFDFLDEAGNNEETEIEAETEYNVFSRD